MLRIESAGKASVHVMLASLLVLSSAIGNYAAYLALAAALVAILAGLATTGSRAVLREGWVLMTVAAFTLITIAFVANARDGADLLLIFDFSPLLFAALLAVPLAQVAGPHMPRRIADMALAGAVLAVAVGVHDVFIQGQPRAMGLENSPIHFANLAVILGFMAMGGLLVSRARHRFVYTLGPAFGLVAALLAGTRGALLVMLALLVVGSLFALYAWRARISVKLGVATAAVATLAAVIGLGHLMGFTRPYEFFVVAVEVAQGRSVSDPSTFYRLDFYQAGTKAFFDAPLFGHGWQRQISSAFAYMTPETRAQYPVEQWAYLHNEPLGFAVGAGVTGLVAYGLFMAAPIVGVFNAPRDGQRLVRGYFACVLVFGVFTAGVTDVLFMSELPKTFYCLLVAAVLVLCRDAPAARQAMKS